MKSLIEEIYLNDVTETPEEIVSIDSENTS